MVALMSSVNPDTDWIRVRVPVQLKGDFEAITSRKKISLQDAISGMIEWLLTMPDLVQSAILGQIEERGNYWEYSQRLPSSQPSP